MNNIKTLLGNLMDMGYNNIKIYFLDEVREFCNKTGLIFNFWKIGTSNRIKIIFSCYKEINILK